MAALTGPPTPIPAPIEEPGHAPVECHECGTWYPFMPLPPGSSAICVKCGNTLYSSKTRSTERALAMNLAAASLFAIAVAFSFMQFKIEDRVQDNTLFTGILELAENELFFLAGLVLLSSLLAPLLRIAGSLYILMPFHYGGVPPYAGRVFRYVEILRPWAMMEVYLLGVLIAYVNLVDLGSIDFAAAAFAFGLLIPVMVASDAFIDRREVWERLPIAATPAVRPARHIPSETKQDREVLGCHHCQLAVSIDRATLRHGHVACPRCGAAVHHRKPDSVTRTMALVVTALVLYFPANIYPVMTVISFGDGHPDTILSGVISLINGGLYPLAALVFFASVAVPMLKLVGLSYLCWSVKRRSIGRLRDKTRLYRIIEYVGRWSMIDVFMVSILIGLVQLGSIATIDPGVGCTAFAAVVIITMFASMSFDPRLMWDAERPSRRRHERIPSGAAGTRH